MENKRQFNQEDISYILEMVGTQEDMIYEGYELIEKVSDLHEYGEFVTSVRYSDTLETAWNDEDSDYRYWSEVFNDEELMQKAVNEVVEKIKGGRK